MVPGRAGQPTQVLVHMTLGQLRGTPGASPAEDAWAAARASQPGWLTGPDADAAACDATLIPVVTGHLDWAALDQLTDAFLLACACDIHHILPRNRAGPTSLANLVPLCSFHHLTAIHRWGWTLRLNNDGTTTATSPDGARTLHSHSPPSHGPPSHGRPGAS